MTYACPVNYQPKIISQIKTSRPQGSGDCGPAAVLMVLRVQSCNQWVWSSDYDERAKQMSRVRKLGGAATSGGTYIDELYAALTRTTTAGIYNPFSVDFAALNLARPQGQLLKNGTSLLVNFDSVLKPKLILGWWALVEIKYGPIDWYPGTADPPGYNAVTNPYAGSKPNYHVVSGQWGYRDRHYIVIGEYHDDGAGNLTVTVLDPLEDGRFSGSGNVTVNQGPCTLPLPVVKAACALNAGTGLTNAIIFREGIPSTSTDPTTVAVPNIVNVVEATALASLTSANLIDGTRTEASHATIVAGNVISESPASGTVVPINSTVDYVVSTGTAPAGGTLDPNPPSPCEGAL